MLSSTADRVQEALPNRMREVFAGQGIRDGEFMQPATDLPGDWNPGDGWLPTSGIALRNRKNAVLEPNEGGWLTLVDTGAQRDSIKMLDRKDAPTRVEVFFGATVPYVAEMELGSVFEGHDVPSRPSQFATEADADMVEAEIDSALRSVMGAT